MLLRKMITLLLFLLLMATISIAYPASSNNQPAAKSADDPVTGEWDASFHSKENSDVSFTLKLKLDGDKVTGSTESSHGTFPISEGTFVGNKLTLKVDSSNGLVVLTGMVKNGKIEGEFDFTDKKASKRKDKWTAKKK